jgi:hypothetical protein
VPVCTGAYPAEPAPVGRCCPGLYLCAVLQLCRFLPRCPADCPRCRAWVRLPSIVADPRALKSHPKEMRDVAST